MNPIKSCCVGEDLIMFSASFVSRKLPAGDYVNMLALFVYLAISKVVLPELTPVRVSRGTLDSENRKDGLGANQHAWTWQDETEPTNVGAKHHSAWKSKHFPISVSSVIRCALLLTNKLREPFIWVFGSNLEKSDFQLATTSKGTGVSGRHFCNTSDWAEMSASCQLISAYTLMRSSKLGRDIMVRDSRIIPSSEDITVEAGIVSLSIYIPERGKHQDTFDKTLSTYLDEVEPAIPRIATFDSYGPSQETLLVILGKRMRTHFLIEEEGDIGKGAFGTVSKALDLVTGNLYAAKRFVGSKASMEIDILQNLSHVSLLFISCGTVNLC